MDFARKLFKKGKFIKKTCVFSLILLLMFGLMAGCNKTDAQETPQAQGTNGQEAGNGADGQMITITDMAGRSLEVPAKIDKIYGTDPIASILVYTVDPEKMAGWNYKLNDLEKELILPEYHDLTVFGMGDNVNLEAIIKAAPQICLQVGSLGDAEIANADKLQGQLGIPVVMLDGDLAKIPEALQFLGKTIGLEARTEDLSAYAQKLLDMAQSLKPAESEQATVYFGNGAQSLETAPPGSPAAAVLTTVKADNVAKVESDGARIQITMEQLLAWDPEYIFVSGEPKENLSGPQAAQAIMNNPDYSTLQAVKAKNVYGIPKSPFTWMGRPMGINQLIGLAWVGNVLYPEHFAYDLNDEVKTFYQKFYHVELSDEQVADLFAK
jgi:iron complex transport system substrate-binding protein